MRSQSPNDEADNSANLGVVLGVLGGLALTGLFVLIAVPLARYRKRHSRVSTQEDVESGFFGSRRSSFRHQKMQRVEVPSGPGVLLPLIDRVSNITWSDLRSKNSSTDSMKEEVDYSFRTDNATTSHIDSGTPGVDDIGPDIVDQQMMQSGSQSSPTPPGLPAKIDASTATTTRSSMPSEGPSRQAGPGMFPLSPVSPVFSSSATRSGSRSKAVTHKPGMEPLMEDTSYHQEGSRQLPSPPSSPDQFQPNWAPGSSRRRPGITGSHSSPSTLPFRPRSSTGPSVPLTTAFRTSLLHSNTQSSHMTAATQRYPSITSSPPPVSRSRASSVSIDAVATAQSQDAQPQPVIAPRRLSTTDIRHRHPASAAASGGGTSRAFLRSGEAARSPQYQEAGPSSFQRPKYEDAVSYTTSRPERPSPPTHLHSSPRPLSTSDVSRLPPSSLTWKAQPQSQSQQQPSLVRRKDSLALRPLPASLFAPPVPSVPSKPPSRETSSASTRSRSHSVMSERSLPRHIPPLEPLQPLDFDNFSTASSDESRVKPA